MGMRRLFSLVQWLPQDSAIAFVLREKPTPEVTSIPDMGRAATDELGQRRKPASGWADLAATLSKSKALKKKAVR